MTDADAICMEQAQHILEKAKQFCRAGEIMIGLLEGDFLKLAPDPENPFTIVLLSQATPHLNQLKKLAAICATLIGFANDELAALMKTLLKNRKLLMTC